MVQQILGFDKSMKYNSRSYWHDNGLRKEAS